MPSVRTFIIAQGRMGSTRLPGKVMLPLAGRPVVEWVMDRARRARVDGTVLAIPDLPEDDTLASFATSRGYLLFRGSAADVQARYLDASQAFGADVCVRLTCDNPFVDADLIDRVIDSHTRSRADYSSFNLAGPLPLGLAVEAFSVGALRRSKSLFRDEIHREHVTPAFYENPTVFRLNAVTPLATLRSADVRLTLDTQEDYEALRALVALVCGEDPLFVSAERYVRMMQEHPEIRAINAHVRQKRLGE